MLTGVPCGMRELRHGCAGASAVGKPASRESCRISAFVSPASFRGATTANSAAALTPGRT